MVMQTIDMREAIRQAIDEEMQRDSSVFLLGEEVALYNGAYKVSKGLYDKYGKERVIDTPISELGFSGLAVGAALTGLRPIVEFMSFNFSFVACDQIIQNAIKFHYMSAGLFSVPIVFRGPNGAAAQVSCQHSHTVEAFYANYPGLYVVAPSNAYDAKGLLKTAIRSNNPVLFLESELIYGHKMEILQEEYLVPIGKAKIVRPGNHITIIAHSRMVHICEAACEALEKRGLVCELIDLRTIKPLDKETITQSVQKTHYCLIVEEGHAFAGIASEVAFQITETVFDFLDGPVERLTQEETPMPYAKNLEYATAPNIERVLAAVHKTLNIPL